MNPEMGLAPEMEEAPEIEEQPARTLPELMTIKTVDLSSMSLEELEGFETELQQQLESQGKKARSFAEYAENLPAGIQRKLKKPEGRQELMASYLDTRLNILRQDARQAASAQPDHFRGPVELVQEAPIEFRVEDRLQGVFREAEKFSEQGFQDWTRRALPVDARGHARDYFPDDQRLIDAVQGTKYEQSTEEKEFSDMTARYEVGFARSLQHFDALDVGQNLMVAPPSEFDDVARHVDVMASFKLNETAEPIHIGIDFTITRSDIDQAKKLKRNIVEPLRRVKYGTAEVAAGTEFIPVVVAVDRERADRLTKFFGLEDVPDQSSQAYRDLHEVFSQELERYHDQAVMQFEVVREIEAQVRYQRGVLAERGVTELGSYDALLAHLTGILEKRKGLQSQSREETERDTVRDVYRLSDQRFIRSAA